MMLSADEGREGGQLVGGLERRADRDAARAGVEERPRVAAVDAPGADEPRLGERAGDGPDPRPG